MRISLLSFTSRFGVLSERGRVLDLRTAWGLMSLLILPLYCRSNDAQEGMKLKREPLYIATFLPAVEAY